MGANTSGNGGLNFVARLSIEEAIANAQKLKKELASISKNTTTGGVSLDTKPLTAYQAEMLKIKQQALDMAKAKQEQAAADKSASLALQEALKQERLARAAINTQIAKNRLEQQAANKLAKEQSQQKKTYSQPRDFKSDLEAQAKFLNSTTRMESAINAETVARARLNVEAAKQAIAQGTLNAGTSSNVAGSNAQAEATKGVTLSKKQLAQMLAEEKLRQQQATAELKNNAREMLNAKGSIEQRKAALERLLTVYNRMSAAERESAAGMRLGSIIGGLKDQIKSIEDQVNTSKSAMAGFFDYLKNNILGVLGPIALLTAAWNTAKAVFSHTVEISDNFTDVQRTAKLSKEEVSEFAKELKKLDTRTDLEHLLDIGFIGGRLSVPKKDLEDFVKQVDELSVVLKKEFPGGAEAVAESLGKIVTIYKITQKEGVSLGTALSKVGSNLLELAHSGPVTVKYLQDFTLGVAGTAVSAKLSLPVISAYGAVLGESGQIASSSALAVTRLVNGLTTKPGKYAAIAQLADSTLTVEKFTKIINTDTKQALDLFFKGLNSGNPVQTEFASRLDSVGIKTGKVSNAVKILAENQDKLTDKIRIGTKGYEENTSVAHNFELANDNLAASVDKLHNSAVNLVTDPNSSLAAFFKGLIDGSTYAIKAISDLDEALTKTQLQKDQKLVDKTKPSLFNAIFNPLVDRTGLEEAKARLRANASQVLNNEIAGKGYAKADILSANKDEIQIRKLLTGEINKQKIALDRLANALAFVSNPKNSRDQTVSVEKNINRLRESARQQNAVVERLRAKLPKDPTVYGDGTMADETETPRTTEVIKAEIKALQEADKKLSITSEEFKANIIKIKALKKELKLALGGKDTEAIREANAENSALQRAKSVGQKLSDLLAESLRNQKESDNAELDSVRDKYAKMRAEIDKFYSDPNNRNRPVVINGKNVSKSQVTGMIKTGQSQDEELVRAKQSVEATKLQIETQKQLFADYEQYKTQFGESEAEKRFAADLKGYKTYVNYVKSLIPDESKTDVGSNKLRDLLNKDILPKAKNDDAAQQRKQYDDAYQAALTYTQKLAKINEDYSRQRWALGAKATDEQIANLNRERNEKIRSENETNAYLKSGYSELMMSFNTMTRDQALKRLKIIKDGYQQQYDEGKINADQLTKLTDPINAGIDSLNGNNPFKKIGTAIENYRKQLTKTSKDSLDARQKQALLFDAISEGAGEATRVIGELANSFQELGIGGEELQATFRGIQSLAGGFGEIMKGLKPGGNPVDIITGSIKLLTSALDLFNKKDKRLEKQINAYKQQLTDLGRAYAQLERDVNNAVGEDYYSKSNDEIANLLKQQELLKKSQQTERDKKKSDQGKIDEYQNQIDAIPGKIEDIQKAISQSLIQTTFRDLSNSLADAFAEAFKAGENGINKMDDVFNSFISNAIKNSLKLKILDPVVKKFTDELTQYAKDNNNSIIGFDFEKWKQQIGEAGKQFNDALKGSEQFFKDINQDALKSNALTASLNQPTAERLEGLWRGQFDLTKQIQIDIRSSAGNIGKLYEMATNNLNVAVKIEANTFRTANNTDKLDEKLDAIIANTRPQKSARD